jgi:dienelactone hydrolase
MQVTRRGFQLTYPGEPERVIRGRVSLPADVSGPLPWVAVLHGFKGFMDWGFFPELAERLARAGLAAVAFNTSGSGVGADLESFSELEAFRRGTLSRQLEDVERVRALARAGELGPLDPARGGLFGHSRGGGVALVHAAEMGDYRAVVTWAALDDFDRWDEPTKRAWRSSGTLTVVNARTAQELPMSVEVLEDYERQRDRLDVLAACRRLAAPVLALHGGADEAVDPSALTRIAAALGPRGRARTLRLEGAGHTFGAVHPLAGIPPALEQALRETVGWFLRHLEPAAELDRRGGP